MPSFTALYSGSSGNCSLVQQGEQNILIDIGKNCKQTCLALEEAGVKPGMLSAILITHEHSDHIGGLRVFLKKYPMPVYSNPGTLTYLRENGHIPDGVMTQVIGDAPIEIAGFQVRAFPLSHDAAGCCGFQLEKDGHSMSLATDLGKVDEAVYSHLTGAELVVLEANYDKSMLMLGPYPYALKRRIASENGHLCNEETARIVARLVQDGCSKIALCHLSQENNSPSQALMTVRQQLSVEGIGPARQAEIQLLCCRRHGLTQTLLF